MSAVLVYDTLIDHIFESAEGRDFTEQEVKLLHSLWDSKMSALLAANKRQTAEVLGNRRATRIVAEFLNK